MGFLDAYDTFVCNKCQELSQQNGTLEKITNALGLGSIVGGVQDYISKGVIESLKDSPLRELAEDVLSEMITNNARRLSQNILNQVPAKLTKTLTDLRSTAFNTVFTAMTLQNNMALFFASTVAQNCVDAIREKRQTLITLRESVRQLHNALLVLAGGGPFFNGYLENLRRALVLLDESDGQLAIVRAAFFSQTRFPLANFNRASSLLQEAFELIMPPVTGEDAKDLNEGFLKNVLEGPSYGRQLATLMAIPKLTMQMLASYDLYAIKVLKVNALLLGFQSVIQSLTEVTGGMFKDLILGHIDDSRTALNDIIESMALNLNGDIAAIGGPIQVLVGNPRDYPDGNMPSRPFKPNPTKTSARAIEWGARIKVLQVQLAVIDPNALQALSNSNDALRAYNNALQALSRLDDRRSATAILRATDGREQPGDIEADMVTLAFQANQAIIDSSLTAGDARSNPKNVIALGAKLGARLDLSIDQDREIEDILLRFIQTIGPIIQDVKTLGDSIFKLLDTLGMDRAADFLKKGAFGEFFSMNGRTSTYVGAAVAGLSAIQSLLSSEDQRQCINNSINQLKVEETSKKLASQRAVSINFAKQQKQNEDACADYKRTKSKTEGCSVGLDVHDLKSNPVGALQGIFRGVFGGDIKDSLQGSSTTTSASPKGDCNLGLGGSSGSTASGITPKGLDLSAAEAQKAAEASMSSAKSDMASAINGVGAEGFVVSENDSFGDLKEKLSAVKDVADPEQLLKIGDADASAGIAESLGKNASDLLKNSGSATNIFGRFGV